jgi:hypothetical protein
MKVVELEYSSPLRAAPRKNVVVNRPGKDSAAVGAK